MTVLQFPQYGEDTFFRIDGIFAGPDILAVAGMSRQQLEAEQCLLFGYRLEFRCYGVQVVVVVDIDIFTFIRLGQTARQIEKHQACQCQHADDDGYDIMLLLDGFHHPDD